ncbi:MAG: hypothetical protein IPF56_04530 [Chloroflexi bacterium]|nr:hypothetical protein [Chloroflexota bacterium]
MLQKQFHVLFVEFVAAVSLPRIFQSAVGIPRLRLSPCAAHFALVPTGMTIENVGMTIESVGMTIENMGMTIENMGMTIENMGMTIDERTIQTPRVGVGSLDWLGIKPLGSV